MLDVHWFSGLMLCICSLCHFGGFMLDVHWFSGLMLCICSLCHFVCDSLYAGRSAVLCYAYAVYVILCAIALNPITYNYGGITSIMTCSESRDMLRHEIHETSISLVRLFVRSGLFNVLLFWSDIKYCISFIFRLSFCQEWREFISCWCMWTIIQRTDPINLARCGKP